MNAKAANSDFRGMCFIRLIVQHIFIGAVFSFSVKKWLFYVIITIFCHFHDSGHGIDRSELSSSTDRTACDAIFSHLPAMSRHALACAVPHCIADTAASRSSIPKAQGFDAMNRYSLTDQSRIFRTLELVAEPRGSVTAGGHTFQVGTVADDNRGNYECKDSKHNERECFLRGSLPLMKNPAPHRGENDDRGHVERP